MTPASDFVGQVTCCRIHRPDLTAIAKAGDTFSVYEQPEGLVLIVHQESHTFFSMVYAGRSFTGLAHRSMTRGGATRYSGRFVREVVRQAETMGLRP